VKFFLFALDPSYILYNTRPRPRPGPGGYISLIIFALGFFVSFLGAGQLDSLEIPHTTIYIIYEGSKAKRNNFTRKFENRVVQW